MKIIKEKIEIIYEQNKNFELAAKLLKKFINSRLMIKIDTIPFETYEKIGVLNENIGYVMLFDSMTKVPKESMKVLYKNFNISILKDDDAGVVSIVITKDSVSQLKCKYILNELKYLLKLISEKEFHESIEKLERQLNQEKMDDSMDSYGNAVLVAVSYTFVYLLSEIIYGII